MRTLEAARGRGRDDYPVRAMWNSVLAGIVSTILISRTAEKAPETLLLTI